MIKKELKEKFLNPTTLIIVLTFIGTAIFIALSLTLVIIGTENSPVLEITSYAVYGLSALLLSYTVYIVVIKASKIKAGIIKWLNSHAVTKRILHDYGFRTLAFALSSFLFSILYGIYNGVIALMSLAMWYGALAFYYIFLAFLRGGVFLYHGKHRGGSTNKLKETRVYRNCGILLMIIITALSAAILQMVKSGVGFEYAGLLIYAAAAYAFIKITTSIINVIKARRHENMTIRAMRSINFADALVSILALQTALLTTFSEEGINVAPANAATGAVVCALIFTFGLTMLIKGNKQIKLIKSQDIKEENNG